MPSCCAAAASRARSRPRSPGAPGKARVSSPLRSFPFTGLLLAFLFRRRRMAAPERGDAIGGGAAGRIRAAADDGGDVGVGQPGQVVVGDGLFLFGGQPGDGPSEIAVEAIARTIRGRAPPRA